MPSLEELAQKRKADRVDQRIVALFYFGESIILAVGWLFSKIYLSLASVNKDLDCSMARLL